MTELESISFYPANITFNTMKDSSYLCFRNFGDKTIKWKINKNDNFISCSRDSGYISNNKKDSVCIFINSTTIPSDDIDSKLTFFINNDRQIEVPITVHNLSINKKTLPYNFIDAEFDNIHNLIVCVSDFPLNYLRILDPETLICDSIKLEYTPTCVSVSPDGKKAAVGHNKHITYIDLTNKTIINTYDFNCYISDVVISNNYWAYAFTTNQSGTFSINLSDGSNFRNQSNFHLDYNAKAKLQPSGKYIYTADNLVSPDDIEKLDITNDTLKFLYDSQYHGNYNMNGDLWISEDGERIFVKSGNVFRSSEIFNNDIYYNGNLTNSFNILWLHHSSKAKRIYAISSIKTLWSEDPEKTRLDVYEANYLNHLGKIDLKKFKKVNWYGQYDYFDALGRFVFVNSAGRFIYVISQIEVASGDINSWGFEKIKIE